jgi:hypothetical protein
MYSTDYLFLVKHSLQVGGIFGSALTYSSVKSCIKV